MSKWDGLYNQAVILQYFCEEIPSADFREHFKLWSRIHLEDPRVPAPIQSDVDPQLQRAGRNDDAVVALRDRLLGAAALVAIERAV